MHFLGEQTFFNNMWNDIRFNDIRYGRVIASLNISYVSSYLTH